MLELKSAPVMFIFCGGLIMPYCFIMEIIVWSGVRSSVSPLLFFFFQGRCARENCKYLHPPPHLKTQLEINGRNNLIQQKAAAAMLAQQMHFMLPGAQLQPIVSPPMTSILNS